MKKQSKRAIWGVIYRLKGVWLGLQAMRCEQLGSEVIYQGKMRIVSNWSNSSHPTLCSKYGEEHFYKEYVPRSEIQNVLSLREFLHRFKTIYRWYMSSWYRIDVNKRCNNEKAE